MNLADDAGIAPDLVVYERTGHWSAGLRTAIERLRRSQNAGARSPRIAEVRTLGEVGDALSQHNLRLLMLEIAASNAARVLDFVARLDGQHPNVKNIVVCRPPESGWEMAARAAGAIHFVTSVADLSLVAELAQIEARRVDAQQPRDPIARIWAGLPWPTAKQRIPTGNNDG